MIQVWSSIKKTLMQVWEKIRERTILFWKKLKKAWQNHDSLLWYFLTLVAVGALFFSFALLTNLFTIPLSGDYVLQQIPFYLNGYDDWWHFLKTGEFVLWDSSTYLGSNNIGSNAFYYLLNPFFLPILLFPRALVPQGLAVLMILKMAGAGLVFRAFLKYMGVSERNARLFGLVYAFCGWNVYYLWFNHFMEVCLVFPLIFWGIEKLLKEKKPWLLMFALFLMGVTNFFFLISTCFTGVFYALFRYFQRIRTYKGKEALGVAFMGIGAFATGIMMSAFVILPAMIIAVTAPRATGGTYLPNLIAAFKIKDWVTLINQIMTWEASGGTTYDKWYPLISFFFPTVSCRSSALLNTGSYDNTISSLFVFTPIMLFLVPSILNSIRQRKWSHIIAITLILFALFTPFFYYMLQGFTSVDYGRWQIFVVLCLLVYIALNYEQREKMPRWFFDVSFVFVIGMAIFVFFVAKGYEETYNFGEMEERAFVGYGELVYIVAAYIFMRGQFKRERLTRSLMYMISVEAIVMGTLTMNIHSLSDYKNGYNGGIANVTEETEIIRNINRDDKEFFRIYNLNAAESSNLGMREGYNGMTAFHSLYNFELSEFNEWSHMNYNHGGWSMGYHEKRINLDTFLNVKYYIIKNIYDSYSWSGEDEYGNTIYTHQNVPFGFERVPEYSTDLHTVYRNTNFIEGGFSYDNIVVTDYSEETQRSDFYNNYADEPINNEEVYLRSAILRNDDAEEVVDASPNLGLGQRPNREADLENTNVERWTCDSLFNSGHPNESEGCLIDDISNSVTAYVPEFSRIVITPSSKAYFGNTAEGYIYYLRWILDSRMTAYFFDQNDQLIIRDAHSFVSTSFKYMRGYYSPVPVKKIVVIPHNVSARAIYYPNLYSEPYSAFQDRLDGLNAYPLENMEHTSNTFDFDTNYAQRRFIVMSVPYDAGWHVTVTNENGETETPVVYKAQGGFVGFLSGVGKCHYDLNYWTPYLTEGILISITGFFLFSASWGAVFVVQKKREEREAALAKEKKIGE